MGIRLAHVIENFDACPDASYSPGGTVEVGQLRLTISSGNPRIGPVEREHDSIQGKSLILPTRQGCLLRIDCPLEDGWDKVTLWVRGAELLAAASFGEDAPPGGQYLQMNWLWPHDEASYVRKLALGRTSSFAVKYIVIECVESPQDFVVDSIEFFKEESDHD